MYTLWVSSYNPLFGYFYWIKVMFDNNYRYRAQSIGLISDWIKVRSAVHKPAFRAFKQIKLIMLIYELLKKTYSITFKDYGPFKR